MTTGRGQQRGWRTRLARAVAPFPEDPPPVVRTPLIQLQYQRLHALTPLLCLTIAANTVAMALAVMGELPVWQQAIPPAILLAVTLWFAAHWRPIRHEVDPGGAERRLRQSVYIAGALGLVAGTWTVNAFRETEQYYCVVAPVFLALSALVSANCLSSVPRAASIAMATALAPIVVRMLAFDNLGIRTMAVMLVMIAALQHRLVLAKFRETVRMLTLQHDIVQLAESDALTGLANRRAFTKCLDSQLTAGKPATLVMIDLDGFKAANDQHGHYAGDVVLAGVAHRMRTILGDALCLARLGGDEFAVVSDRGGDSDFAERLDALRAVIALPYSVEDSFVSVSASIGLAHAPQGGISVTALMRMADRALYADKRRRRRNVRQRVA